MLTDHPKLEGTMPTAWLETAYQVEPGQQPKATPFRLVCDETSDKPLAAVTRRYTLVTMRDMISALDVASSELGFQLEPLAGLYRRGQGFYRFTVEGSEFQLPGDSSTTKAQVVLRNDYRASGSLKMQSGWYRLVCSNGMVVGTVASQAQLRHVGIVDVYGAMREMLQGLGDRLEVERLLAEKLASTRWTDSEVPDRQQALEAVRSSGRPRLLESIVADTPERYVQPLQVAVWENQRSVGQNLWAVAQAVSEVATHRMRGANADDWAQRQLRRIEQLAR